MLIQIFIKLLDGKTKVMEIENTASVELLMERVKDSTGMPLKYQRLIYQGKQLEPGRYLSDYNIEKESTLYLTARLLGGSDPIMLIVKTLEGKKHTLQVSPQDTIKSLKKELETLTCVYWEDQKIFYKEEELDNDMALELYGIDVENITVYMIKKFSKCSCSHQMDLSGNCH